LNFGNPEHPEVMWQLSESIDGMAEACNDLGIPVVGGNVSLYNESGGNDIDPTPVVGLLGVVDLLVSPPPGWNWREGNEVLLVGVREAEGAHSFPLAGSRWATLRGRRGGQIANFDGPALAKTISFVAGEVASICAGNQSDVTAVHDIGGGGLANALAEMVSVTGLGVNVQGLENHAELFAEFPGRFVVATSDAVSFAKRCEAAGVPVTSLGYVEGTHLVMDDLIKISVAEITSQRESSLTRALENVN
jgi:phosphoribosylformylglycinamidine synthase